MKRILIFGMTDNPGGMESCIMNYYRFIDRSKFQFDFLCNFKTMAYYNEVKKLGGNVFFIPKRSENAIEYWKAVNKFFKNHAKDYHALWFNTCSLANIDYLKLAKKYGIGKRIVHAHNSQNMDSKLRGVLHNINRSSVSKYATDFWSCSNDSSLFFYKDETIKSDKYKIINNAIDISKYAYNSTVRDKYRKDLGLEGKLVIGNVGRFHFQKNHLFLIEIFKGIVDNNKNAILLLVGQGEDEKKIKAKVKEYSLEKNVKFLGARDDVNNIMQAMDIFLLPSLFEGLAVVLIEAQATGLPCFTSNKVVPKEARFTELLKFINLSNNPQEWIESIEKCSLNNNREKAYLSLIGKNYDIKSEVKKIEKYFEG